ncbi:MAG TPA: PQQ-binding-like beta-propeller repeat protein [Planctomycetota bacterium]
MIVLLALLSLPDDWPMWGGRPDRNMVSAEKNLPAAWPKDGGKVLRWTARLGDHTYGNPVVAGGRVYIGTNNGQPRDIAAAGDKGVLMCFSEKDGAFLWQAVHDKLPGGDVEDFNGIGICSTPCVAGGRVYYVSNRAELVCREAADGKVAWILDLKKDLGVFLHQAAASSPLVHEGRVFVHTGNGTHLETKKVKAPEAPSFIAVDAASGKVVWKDASPGADILNGQWSSPAVAGGRVVFAGGDARLYAFEAATGKKLWTFEAPKTQGNNFVSTPAIAGTRVIVATGQDPEAGTKPGCLLAVDLQSGKELWRAEGEAFGCAISTVAVDGGLLYATELQGVLSCRDVETGKSLWSHDLLSLVWGSPLVADGKVYVRNADGEVVIFQAGREKKRLSKNTLPGLSHGTCVAANGALYVAGDKALYALRAE